MHVHLVPTQELLDTLAINDGKFDEPEEFYERFYDTQRCELLNNKCWLRERSYVRQNRSPEWVFQVQSQNLDDGTHFYRDYRGCQEEIVEKIKKHVKFDRGKEMAAKDLASLCPIIIGAFLTQRFYPLQPQETEGGDSPYLDRCYFDLQDASEQYRYNVVTYTLRASSKFQHLPSEWMPAPTKIAEYLRRNWPSRYSMLVEHDNVPLFNKEGEAILDRLLPAHPSEEILQDIDPRKYQALQNHKRLEEKLIATKRNLVPDLLEQHTGKYAVCNQEGREVVLAEDQFEAHNIARERKRQGEEVFVFPITRDSLEGGASDGAVLDRLPCKIVHDHNQNERVFTTVWFSVDGTTAPDSVRTLQNDQVVDTGNPYTVCFHASAISDMMLTQKPEYIIGLGTADKVVVCFDPPFEIPDILSAPASNKTYTNVGLPVIYQTRFVVHGKSAYFETLNHVPGWVATVVLVAFGFSIGFAVSRFLSRE